MLRGVWLSVGLRTTIFGRKKKIIIIIIILNMCSKEIRLSAQNL